MPYFQCFGVKVINRFAPTFQMGGVISDFLTDDNKLLIGQAMQQINRFRVSVFKGFWFFSHQTSQREREIDRFIAEQQKSLGKGFDLER